MKGENKEYLLKLHAEKVEIETKLQKVLSEFEDLQTQRARVNARILLLRILCEQRKGA